MLHAGITAIGANKRMLVLEFEDETAARKWDRIAERNIIEALENVAVKEEEDVWRRAIWAPPTPDNGATTLEPFDQDRIYARIASISSPPPPAPPPPPTFPPPPAWTARSPELAIQRSRAIELVRDT